MSTLGETQSSGTLDLSSEGDALIFPMGSRAAFAVQAKSAIGSWQTAVVTITRSHDRYTWDDLETPLAFSAAGISNQTDACFPWLRAQVTTAASSAAYAEVIIHTLRDA